MWSTWLAHELPGAQDFCQISAKFSGDEIVISAALELLAGRTRYNHFWQDRNPADYEPPFFRDCKEEEDLQAKSPLKIGWQCKQQTFCISSQTTAYFIGVTGFP
nr:cytochrome B561 and DOMON domain-containing protein At5g47530-like [Ipomoea batatas]